MRPESLYFLFSPVTRIKGVGSTTAKDLSRLLPRMTGREGETVPLVRDVLFHLPVGIVDRRFTCPLREAPDGKVCTFVVRVDEHQPPKRGSRRPYRVLCSNVTGDISLVFFHVKGDYLKQLLPQGKERVISGKVEHFDFQLQMTHPDVIAPVEKLAEVQKIEPVYPLTVGLTSRRIAKIVSDALEKLPELDLPSPLGGEGGRRPGEGKEQHINKYGSHSLIPNARELRSNMPEAEMKLWYYLRAHRFSGHKFRRQHPISGNYIADFICLEKRLIIELDGGQHSEQQEYDALRTKFLEREGYSVIRFWNNEVFQNTEAVLDTIWHALENAPSRPSATLPPEGGGEYYPSFKAALILVHNPQTEEDLSPLSPARARLAYDELLANQLHLAVLRQNMQRQPGEVIKGTGALTEHLRKSLPYTLTNGQEQALKEIYADMASGHRMGRLLQGDVGSGKTVVALLAMLKAVEQGMQAALMVPTELIAQQHYEVVTSLLKDLATVRLLTGSVKGKARSEVLEAIASGHANIVIGTHALFQEHVAFKNLALVVIDEQHRFGVEQRMALSAKGNQPHILHMTATPIPRSLAMTLYGDMDSTLLKEKPAGRQPITTRVIPLSRYGEIMDRLKAALARGEKAYWICPLIEGGDEAGDKDLAAAKTRFTEFKTRFGDQVGLVHGRMKKDERDKQMATFVAGKTRILVATTVIEVGVDVRDATIMVIEQAERFGLSQLHQLRGRVGRGSKPSACVLLYTDHSVNRQSLLQEEEAPAATRLAILRETEDGFRIAEEDLKLRGGGDLLGTRQSGAEHFVLTDIGSHLPLLAQANEEAKTILKSGLSTEHRTLLQLFGWE